MNKPSLIHVAQRLFNTPLAIHPEKFNVIVSSLSSRLGLDSNALEFINAEIGSESAAQFADAFRAPVVPAFNSFSSIPSLSSLSADKSNITYDDSGYCLTEDGIAIISIRGTLVKRSSWADSSSGLLSYNAVHSQLSCALANAEVRAVLFDICSPGGETHGMFDLSDYIYSCRGQKPMWAIANDAALSAAYCLASSADRIFVTRTGATGSIGVFSCHTDISKADEKVGVKYTYIHAGKKKVDGNPHEPLSRTARTDSQNEVDRQYDLFTQTVSRNRGKKVGLFRDTEAGVLFADNGLPLLADEVGTFDDAYLSLAKKSGIVVLVDGQREDSDREAELNAESVNKDLTQLANMKPETIQSLNDAIGILNHPTRSSFSPALRHSTYTRLATRLIEAGQEAPALLPYRDYITSQISRHLLPKQEARKLFSEVRALLQSNPQILSAIEKGSDVMAFNKKPISAQSDDELLQTLAAQALGGDPISGKKAADADDAEEADDADSADAEDSEDGKKAGDAEDADDAEEGKKGEAKKGKKGEAKKGDYEMKKGKGKKASTASTASTAASKDDDNDENEEDDEDEDDMPKKKNSSADASNQRPNSAASQIANLCNLAGKSHLAGRYISKGFSVAQVIDKLQTQRSAESNSPDRAMSTNNGTSNYKGASALDRLMVAVGQYRSANPGMSKADATLKLLSAQPGIYEAYLEERDDATAIPSQRKKYSQFLQSRLVGQSGGGIVETLMARNSGDAVNPATGF